MEGGVSNKFLPVTVSQEASAKADTYQPPNIVAGNPFCTTHQCFESDEGGGAFTAGMWTSEVGKWSFTQLEYDEFCYILEGELYNRWCSVY